MKRFSSNQFHMGLGKRFDVNFPGRLINIVLLYIRKIFNNFLEKKSFHMGLGKRSVENVGMSK